MPRPLYALRVPPDLADLIRSLHPKLKRKLRAALEQIAAEPRLGKPLKDELEGLWSLRLGRFRIIYRLGAGRDIELVAFGPRERIYEETARLMARGK
jgi:mRNA interferase RelE/StbE